MPIPTTLNLSIPVEVKESVEKAIARFWRRTPHSRMIERWAGENFPNDEGQDDLTKFLRVCAEAYATKNRSFFVQLGHAMRRKPASPPISRSAESNNLATWLLAGWVGTEFVESVLEKYSTAQEYLMPLKELRDTFTQRGLVPLCFYSVSALCALHNEVFLLQPQVSPDSMKKTCQRLGLKRPSKSPLVRRIEFQAPNTLIQHLKKGQFLSK